ncbi:hypothetical protein LINGRAHAP2_LOCUS11247 [Linum grandiflorum]
MGEGAAEQEEASSFSSILANLALLQKPNGGGKRSYGSGIELVVEEILYSAVADLEWYSQRLVKPSLYVTFVKDKVGSKSGTCGQDHWMDNIDLLGITILFNWSIVVYAWGYGKAFGRTYLPLSIGPGVERPTSIVSLVNNGTHWAAVQLCDVDGVYALPEFQGMWTGIHHHHEVKCLYASEILRPPSIAADWVAPVRKPLYMCVCQTIQPITQHVQPLLPSLSTLSTEPNSIQPPCKRSPNIPTHGGISSAQVQKVLVNPGLQ